jgi:hypothetical protein
MQIIIDRLNGIIRSALRAYLAAERDLNGANEAGDPAEIAAAKEKVDLAARQAVDLLHHFADFVCKEPDPSLPVFKKPEDVRNVIRPLCVFGRSGPPIDDVNLLMDVADAFSITVQTARAPPSTSRSPSPPNTAATASSATARASTAAPSRLSSPARRERGAPCRRSSRTFSTHG